MKSKTLWWILGAVGIFFLISSLTITIVEYSRFKGQSASFPSGSTIAEVPVSGLNAEAAVARLNETYSLPLDLLIGDSTIAATPADLGFEMDAETLVQTAMDEIQGGGYWAYLWNRVSSSAVSVPLDATVNTEILRAYLLNEIEPRYTQTGTPANPDPQYHQLRPEHFRRRSGYWPGGHRHHRRSAGSSKSTRSPLAVTGSASGSPDWSTLEAFLKHNIEWTGFDGLVEVYIQSMESGQTLQFATWDGADVVPDIAYTGGSTIKVPIIISIFRHLDEPTSDTVIPVDGANGCRIRERTRRHPDAVLPR